MFSGFSTPSPLFRVLPGPTEPGGPHPASDDAELASALHFADPGPLVLLPGRGAPTFVPPSSAPAASSAWQTWQDAVFRPVLAPALVRAAICAGRDNARELRAGDLALADALTSGVTESARDPGHRLLRRLRAARGVRWVARLQFWAAEGETPALFPTVFAGHCALFHLPLRTMLLAYAACEWRAAGGGELGEALAASRPAVDGTLADLARDGHVSARVQPNWRL